MRSAIAIPYACVLFGVAVTTAAMAETEQRSFDVAAGNRFVLDADWGQVDIETWDRDGVEIVVERSDKLEELTFEEQDGTVAVRSRKKDLGIRGWFGSDPGPAFRVTVPNRFDLDLTTAGGRIVIADIDGEVVARTSGGDLKIGEVTGSVHGRTAGGSIRIGGADGSVDAKTSGGSILVGHAAGSVDARTAGGSIRIRAARGRTVAHTSGGSIELGDVSGPIDARTTGGSIRATLAQQPDGDSKLRTTGGVIELAVAEDLKLEIDARTVGGRVSADLPDAAPECVEKSALVATVNGGGPKLRLRTTGGSIRLRTL